MEHGGMAKKLPMPKKMLEIDIEPKEHEEEEPEHEEMDHELNDMVADEFFEAVEKKDKKGLLEAMRALVMQCGEK